MTSETLKVKCFESRILHSAKPSVHPPQKLRGADRRETRGGWQGCGSGRRGRRAGARLVGSSQ